jgi:glyoxylase-like metal-dependent hydrolase (beta-lactamase superfamily II)
VAGLCAAQGLRLAVDRLAFLSHWVTPPGRPKRFDTRFFVAEAPHGQAALHDGTEIVDHRWVRPADALAPGQPMKFVGPTQATLAQVARFDSAAAVVAWARAQGPVPAVMPRLALAATGPRPVLPGEPAYAEVARLDPHGRGDVHCEIRPGTAVRLSPRLIRVTADNGSAMTGPGTNTYLVGGGMRNEWAVIDPGPADPRHVQAVLAAAPGPVRWIFVTHTHLDHSPATAALKAATGARVHGRLADHPEWQDATFAPDEPLRGGERIELPGCDAVLRVIHTPGHASNHLCYLLEQERLLFTGDHLMQQSTVVINPPDGDMAAYLASLQRLQCEALDWLAPGHGFLMAEPQRAIAHVIAHRRKREDKVAGALADAGPAPAEALLPIVYDDVPQRLHGVALRSLKAHLLKLRDDGRAFETDGRWAAATPRG